MDKKFMGLELLIAARKGNRKDFIKIVNDNKLNINDETTPEGNTVLHMAARLGRMELVREIVNRHPPLVLKSNLKGQTPVHDAARAGQHKVVKYFIESVEKFRSIHIGRFRDNYGNTPLHGAVRNRHGAVVKELADHDKESLLLINDAGESPLSIAIDMRFTEIAKCIITLNESTLKFIGHNGQTALHYALVRNDPDMMNFILKSGKDLVSVQDEKKRTPLHYAAALGHHTMVKNLLEKDPLVAYKKDKNQQIPIHLAAENGQVSLIKMLLKRCPDTVEIVDNKQRNILHLAAKTGNLDVASHILNLPELEDLINSRDADGNTPLHLATQKYYGDVVAVLSQNPKVEIRAINKYNKTALGIVKLPDDRGMELPKHLTLKALKSAYKKRDINPEDDLEDTQLDDVKVEKASKDGNNKGRDMAQMISLMSTLIATFTFTAAFTIPGGLKNDGIDEGMATFINKSAFRAFVISDTIAMTSSITAAVIVLSSASNRDTESFMNTLPFAIGLTWLSLVAMTLAFVTGLFVVLQKTMWLAILVCAIGCFPPFCLYILAPTSIFGFEGSQRHKIVDDNPFLFTVGMIKIACPKIGWIILKGSEMIMIFVRFPIKKLRKCLRFKSRYRSFCRCTSMC